MNHTERGLLSMANRGNMKTFFLFYLAFLLFSGKDTNGSQFFICFSDCQHLDGVHQIFGRVVDGLDVLDQVSPLHFKLSFSRGPFDPFFLELMLLFYSGKDVSTQFVFFPRNSCGLVPADISVETDKVT
jgi:hypothetical protein